MDEDEQFTDEELEQFEREYEERRREMFEGDVQPGEINVREKNNVWFLRNNYTIHSSLCWARQM